jgi:PERQ amino acid-rich with GYF domain-containing protein
MITEAVHGASNTIDSRHFAEEFLRRKKMADKGLIDTSMPPKSASPHNASNGQAGGWNEVAKKGPVKEPSKDESNGAFRMVAAKKKGGKR